MSTLMMKPAGAAVQKSKSSSLRTRIGSSSSVPSTFRPQVTCSATEKATEVPKTSVAIVGGTGTLGRQITRKALDDGFDVRVFVRPRERPADFIRDWGATTVQCDLTDPASIPAALVGVHTVIDCATAR